MASHVGLLDSIHCFSKDLQKWLYSNTLRHSLRAWLVHCDSFTVIWKPFSPCPLVAMIPTHLPQVWTNTTLSQWGTSAPTQPPLSCEPRTEWKSEPTLNLASTDPETHLLWTRIDSDTSLPINLFLNQNQQQIPRGIQKWFQTRVNKHYLRGKCMCKNSATHWNTPHISERSECVEQLWGEN